MLRAKGKQGDVESCGESSEIGDLEQVLDQSCRAVAWQSQCYSWAGGSPEENTTSSSTRDYASDKATPTE